MFELTNCDSTKGCLSSRNVYRIEPNSLCGILHRISIKLIPNENATVKKNWKFPKIEFTLFVFIVIIFSDLNRVIFVFIFFLTSMFRFDYVATAVISKISS